MKKRNMKALKSVTIVEAAGAPVELCPKCRYALSNCVCRWQTKKIVHDTTNQTPEVTCDL